MIKIDDQPPMSSAADAWAESVLIKYINIVKAPNETIKISRFKN